MLIEPKQDHPGFRTNDRIAKCFKCFTNETETPTNGKAPSVTPQAGRGIRLQPSPDPADNALTIRVIPAGFCR